MKHLLTLVTLLALIGCAGTWYIVPAPKNHDRVSEIAAFVAARNSLEPSPDVIKRPMQTLEDRSGDCADLSALIAYWLVEERLLPFEFVIWDGGYDALHANIRYYGVVYDPVFPGWTGEGWIEIESRSWGDLQATWSKRAGAD